MASILLQKRLETAYRALVQKLHCQEKNFYFIKAHKSFCPPAMQEPRRHTAFSSLSLHTGPGAMVREQRGPGGHRDGAAGPAQANPQQLSKPIFLSGWLNKLPCLLGRNAKKKERG